MDLFKKRTIGEEWRKIVDLSRAACGAAGLPVTTDQRRWRELRDSRQGQVGFLVGNGPSVRPTDLDAIGPGVSFCCNRFYLAYDRMKFRPSYIVSSDDQMIADFGAEMTQRAQAPVFFVSKARPAGRDGFVWAKADWRQPFRFSPNPAVHVAPGGATLVAALQIGYHLGIRKFFLYGVDHSFKFQSVPDPVQGLKTAQGEGNHFIANYRDGRPWIPPLTQLIETAFRECDARLRREGGWVKNATRGGALEVLERISFEGALAEAGRNPSR
jgi:hypothetical protein